MSYKLFLRPRSNLTLESIQGYFSKRAHYQPEQTQFHYKNEQTGVYFSFSTTSVVSEIIFSMNINLPSFFAFEAEEELRQITEDLGLMLLDTQKKGIGGDYDGETFLKDWSNQINFASEAFKRVQQKQDHKIRIYTLPQKELHEMWSWNKNRVLYQEHLGDAYYVPPVWPVKINDMITTSTMWPDGIPTFLPQTHYIIVARDKIGSVSAPQSKHNIAIASWQQAFPVIENYSEKIQDDGYLLNGYTEVPEDVQKFIVNLPPAEHFERISFDNILDQELWRE